MAGLVNLERVSGVNMLERLQCSDGPFCNPSSPKSWPNVKHASHEFPQSSVTSKVLRHSGKVAGRVAPRFTCKQSSSDGLNAKKVATAKRGFGGQEGRSSGKPSDNSRSKKGSKGTGGGSNGRPQPAARVENILKQLDKETGGNSLSIDPADAKQGKVDFVRVDAWGPGEGTQQELENLKLKSFSPAFSSSDQGGSGPFYEQLVRRLQLLESQGQMAVAQAQPLPEFERWSFGENRYRQYLVNQHAVHSALETALRLAGGEAGPAEGPAAERRSETEEAKQSDERKVLGLFGARLGLFRSEAIEADMRALERLENEKAERDEEASSASKGGQARASPSTQTASYAKYLEQLGKRSAGPFTSSIARKEGEEACLQLLAHVFVIHVVHLAAGMRLGAKALSCLPSIRAAGAVSFYRDYPPEARDPLAVFREAINEAGRILATPARHELMMEELPRAMQKTSLLLTEIAVEEKETSQAS
eukprot:TRINITY_DN21848_c0_g1_i1.p1 TRINITY_DN21848_c0_g1~~TRINITY_DN21848_c0_g1_i1.p1  ORF type:complete len:476 (-),score=86.96 TRINITY_DN21848_c0_g1_i1:67-1494(-)